MDEELPNDILASDSSDEETDGDDDMDDDSASTSTSRGTRRSNEGGPRTPVYTPSVNGNMDSLTGRFVARNRGATVRLSEDEDSSSSSSMTTSTSSSGSSRTTSSSSRRRPVAVKSTEYFARRNIVKYLKSRGFAPMDSGDSSYGLETAIDNMKEILEEQNTENLVSVGVNYSGKDVLDEVERFWRFYLALKHEAPPCCEHLKPMLVPMLVYFFEELVVNGSPAEGARLFVSFAAKFNNESPTQDTNCLLKMVGKTACALKFKDYELHKHPLMNYVRDIKFMFTMNTWTFGKVQKFIQTSKTSVMPDLFSHHFVIKTTEMMDNVEETEMDIEVVENGASQPNSDMADVLYRLRGSLDANLPSILVCKSKAKAVCAAVSKHGSMVALGIENSGVRLFEAPAKQHGLKSFLRLPSEDLGPDCSTKALNGHCGTVYDLCFHPRAKYLITAGEDKLMRIWDAHNSICRAVYRGHHNPVWSVDVSGSGTLIATGSMDTTARLWVPERTEYIRMFAGHYFDVDCVKFHPNESYLATGSVDKSVRLWSVNDGSLVRVLVGATGALTCIDFHSNGRLVAAGGEDNIVRIWDLGEGKIVAELEGGNKECRSISFMNDTLAAGYSNGSIQIWNLQNTLASCYSGEEREEDVSEGTSKESDAGVNSLLKLYYKNHGLLYCVGTTSGGGGSSQEETPLKKDS